MSYRLRRSSPNESCAICSSCGPRWRSDQADSGGVLRACAMTLVVAAENAADAERVRQTVGVLMHNHPSRAVILRPGGRRAGTGRPDLRRVLEAVRQKPADLLGGNRDHGRAKRIFGSREVSGAAEGSGSSGGAVVPRERRALEPGPWSRCSRWPTKSSSILRKSPMRIARCSFCAGFAGSGRSCGRSALDPADRLAGGRGAFVRRSARCSRVRSRARR